MGHHSEHGDGMTVNLDSTIEAIRAASFEDPKAQSSTEWRGRIAEALGRRDAELWHALLRFETNKSGYLDAGKQFLAVISGAHMAWVKLTGIRLEVYVYTPEEGEKVVEALKYLGVSNAEVHSFDHQRDGLTHIVKGSLL
jgi:hypothetical protein